MGLICLARKQFVESRIWTFYSPVCGHSTAIYSSSTLKRWCWSLQVVLVFQHNVVAPRRTPEVRNCRNQSFNYVWCGLQDTLLGIQIHDTWAHLTFLFGVTSKTVCTRHIQQTIEICGAKWPIRTNFGQHLTKPSCPVCSYHERQGCHVQAW